VEVKNLVHAGDELVDEFFSVTPVSLSELVESVYLADESSSGGGQFEGPQKVAGLFEVGADGKDFVDQIIHSVDSALFSEGIRDDAVVREFDSLLVNLSVSSLHDEVTDSGEAGVSADNVRLDVLQHVGHGFGHLDENTLVKLVQTQEFQDLTGLRGKLVDTGDTNDKHELSLRLNEEVSCVSGIATFDNQILSGLAVLLVVLKALHLQVVADDLVCLFPVIGGGLLLGSQLSVTLKLFLQVFRNAGSLREVISVNQESFRHV